MLFWIVPIICYRENFEDLPIQKWSIITKKNSWYFFFIRLHPSLNDVTLTRGQNIITNTWEGFIHFNKKNRYQTKYFSCNDKQKIFFSERPERTANTVIISIFFYLKLVVNSHRSHMVETTQQFRNFHFPRKGQWNYYEVGIIYHFFSST